MKGFYFKSSSEQRNSKIKKLFSSSNVLKKVVKKNPIIFDVGSNWGQSIDEYKKIFINPFIYAFEPHPECYFFIQDKYKNSRNIRINNFAIDIKNNKKNFFIHKIGFKNQTGKSSFNKIYFKSKDALMFQGISKKKKFEYLKKMNVPIKVKCKRLDTFVNQKKIKKIDLVKIDTQGHEVKVLKSLGTKLKIIDNIQLEIMLYDFYDIQMSFYSIEKILRKYGFKLYDICYISKNPKNLRTDWVDVIYSKI